MAFVNTFRQKRPGQNLLFIMMNIVSLKKPCNIRLYKPAFIMVKNNLTFMAKIVNYFDI